MANNKTNASDSKKTMDVTKPGNSSPDTSSRPVIITHKPEVSDPMVNKTSETSVSPEKKEVTSTHNKVIQPLTNKDEEQTIENSSADNTKTSEQKEADQEAAVVDAVAGQADLGKKNDQKENEDKKRNEELQKLVDEKKYFVPIGQVSRRRNRRVLLVFIAILLIIAGVYLALDAGLIKNSIDLPFNLIKN